MSRSLVLPLFALGLVSTAVAACGPSEVKHPYQADDKTPANSVSETRLNGDDPSRPKAQVTSVTSPEDPTTAQVNSVNDMPKGDDSASSKEAAAKPGNTKPEKPEKPGKPSKTGPKISKAECDKAFEKAMELEIASKPELQGIDKKQLLAMAKQMGSEKHGEAPCDATRSQYTCAMAATSTSQWKRCME